MNADGSKVILDLNSDEAQVILDVNSKGLKVKPKVRLSPNELAEIKKYFLRHFKKGDQLWIFGSRANPRARGGDIDLYIKLSKKYTHWSQARRKLWSDLQNSLGEQKIDIVINLNNREKSRIYEVAEKYGVRLI